MMTINNLNDFDQASPAEKQWMSENIGCDFNEKGFALVID